MTVRLILIAISALAPVAASAAVQNEPVEIVSESAPTPFTERAGLWPSENLPAETFTNDRSTLNDRWNTVPGVAARESGSPTISIRGSAQADRVLKLFDGTPLNLADGVGGSDLLIPSEVLADVSLMKGPASVFYGASAMAGAVDHRLRYFDEPTISGTLADDTGKFGDRRASLVVPIYSKNSSSRTQVSLMTERDPQDFVYQSTTSGKTGRNDGNLKDLLRATAAADRDLGSGWSLGARLVEAKSTGETSGSIYFPLHSTFNTSASLADLQISKLFENRWLASLKITDVRIWGLYDEGTSTQTTSYTSRTAALIDLDVPLGESLNLKTFSDMSANRFSASYVGDADLNDSDADIGQTLEYQPSPKFSLQPGYRYQSRFGQVFKSLAAILNDDKTSYTFKIGDGFRNPSLSDRFGNYSTFRPNPSLKPEREWSAETSVGYENGRRYLGFLEGVSLKGSLYYTSYDDLVDTQTVGATITKVNRGEARSYGAELYATYGYKLWSASIGYNYLEAKNITLDQPLRLAPRHQGIVTLTQLFGPLVFEAKETLWSESYDTDPATGALQTLPAWKTTDLIIRTLALTNWDFTCGVLDIFDESRELTYGYPEPQRRFFLTASRSF